MPGHYGFMTYRTGRAHPATTDLQHTVRVGHARSPRIYDTHRTGHTRPLRTYDTIVGVGHARSPRTYDTPYGSGTPGHYGLTTPSQGPAMPTTTDFQHAL